MKCAKTCNRATNGRVQFVCYQVKHIQNVTRFLSKNMYCRVYVLFGDTLGEHFHILTPLMGIFHIFVHFLSFSCQFTSLPWVN